MCDASGFFHRACGSVCKKPSLHTHWMRAILRSLSPSHSFSPLCIICVRAMRVRTIACAHHSVCARESFIALSFLWLLRVLPSVRVGGLLQTDPQLSLSNSLMRFISLPLPLPPSLSVRTHAWLRTDDGPDMTTITSALVRCYIVTQRPPLAPHHLQPPPPPRVSTPQRQTLGGEGGAEECDR